MPSANYLRSILRYDPETGDLFWLPRPATAFLQGAKYAAYWNARHAGNKALTAISGSGYRHGKVDMVNQLAHRIIWKMQTGDDPDNVVHRDGDRLNNRWANLVRDVHLRPLKAA